MEHFAQVLPHLPQDLPVIYLKSPHEAIKEKTFGVRPLKIMQALHCLKDINPHYRNMIISDRNMAEYVISEDGILQGCVV